MREAYMNDVSTSWRNPVEPGFHPDPSGNVHATADRSVTVEIGGPAILQGLGTGDPKPLVAYTDTTRTDGCAPAVVTSEAVRAGNGQ